MENKVKQGIEVRVAAARVVHAVRDRGRSLDDALAGVGALDDRRDRPLVQELCYGVLRTLPRQEALAGTLLHRPLRRADRELEALILVGLYQLTETRIPPHAAVAATVEAARTLGRDWAPSLVNALLRRFQRERGRLLAPSSDPSPEVRWLLPRWLLARLRTAWPRHWREIVAAGNARAPMTLRVNRLRTTREDYAQRLAEADLTARPSRYTTHGLTLDRPAPTAGLPGFADGLVSIQDAGAQLAAGLLDARPGERVLDACAAPGGKSAHILERAEGKLELTALDKDPVRLARVGDNLRRLGLSARIVQGDATDPNGAWARTDYHRILLDAPCSGTGVIRRHPDIKWLRRETDIAALGNLQARLLDALWPRLLPGGTLLYVTCSLLPAENEAQIRAFLERRGDARALPLEQAWGLARPYGRQTLPQEGVAEGNTRRGPGMDRHIQRRPAVEYEGIGKSPFSDSVSQKPMDGLLRHPSQEGVAEGDTRRGPGMDRPIQRRSAVEHEGIGKSPVSDSVSPKPMDGPLRPPQEWGPDGFYYALLEKAG
ncbi:MAG: 16S rRNA (cytosine(967)-C(5))-methyltransferase RsmB [Candidatus Thiosymbion ectosymbiont of Robbea hypermnestra]|nr:16S rRNA (cytosine(967)-C(5))-methyltransferase RsmB [Candidatus Thiosymbion ectosymbiont of Robbea hypermnestra]